MMRAQQIGYGWLQAANLTGNAVSPAGATEGRSGLAVRSWQAVLASSPRCSDRRHRRTAGIRFVGWQRFTDPHTEADLDDGDDRHRYAVLHRGLVDPPLDGIERSLHKKRMTANQLQTFDCPGLVN